MDVLIVGATGKTGRLIIPLLLAAGHRPRAMIRAESQSETMLALGAEPVLGDLEGPLADVVRGHTAVIFAAGSGSKTGPEKTIDVDQIGAISLIDACVAENCRRFVMLSAMATGTLERAPKKLHHYLTSKAIADAHLSASSLDATIVRPGYLSDDAATGRVRIGENLGEVAEGGAISRADTAHILVACLGLTNTIGACFEVLAGDTPIEDALAAL
ncbi:MAG: SDR family oxidoreductase [Proteobacteria bacterium]|nr:SDR family oxidoreductase [Pseudomonadota bacterium]MDA1354938.1 SDR family oxidoreductase [Pseudomonadota bacterium]